MGIKKFKHSSFYIASSFDASCASTDDTIIDDAMKNCAILVRDGGGTIGSKDW